jgi:hypothetical protein
VRPLLTGLALTLLGASTLAACTTKPIVYGPIGEKMVYGYSERPNTGEGESGEGFVLTVRVPTAQAPDARPFFDRRAAELCPAGVAKTNIFRADKPSIYSSTYSNGVSTSYRAFVHVELEGYVYCRSETTQTAKSE